MSVIKGSLALLTVAAGVLIPGSATAMSSSSGPALVDRRVTVIGDSVTVDARPNLIADIRGAVVHAEVSEQWDQGVEYVRELRAKARLGAVVVVALGTNGRITPFGMSQMMRLLSPCRRVVLVTNHMPLPWQQPNNRLLRATAAARKNVVIADWHSLAAAHPGWFGSDGVHIAVGGVAARALARLVASKV